MHEQGNGPLRVQVDVGAGVMMQAEALSSSTLLVDVGLGFQLECSMEEAQQIASLQVSAAKVYLCLHLAALSRVTGCQSIP